MRKLKPIWLVLANTLKVKIYHISKNEYLLVKELAHPASRLKSQDLISDRPGHYKTSHAAHGQFIPHDDPHEEEHKHFAKEIIDFLEKSYELKQFKTLVLCAEPHFYGLLNKFIPAAIRKLISKVIMKDYIPFPEQKIREVINEISQKIS